MGATDLQIIGQNIGMRRVNAGYSQEQFADLVGISKTALGRIERGESAPRTETVISVCRELKTTPNEIYPDYLSKEEHQNDPVSEMMKKVQMLSEEQKNQFFVMMQVVFNGIVHTEGTIGQV